MPELNYAQSKQYAEELAAQMQQSGAHIYFVSVRLDRTVHAHAIGFTRFMSHFVLGTTPANAEQRLIAHYANKYQITAQVSGRSSLARTQDTSRYAFPESIV